MSQKTLGLIHTSATLVPVFEKLCKEMLPQVKLFNIVDDSLIKNVIACGELNAQTARRVVNYVGSAAEAGADYILVTCSSIGAAVETAAGLTAVPVLRVDQPMVDLAVRSGSSIGVIATLPTTLGPTSDLVQRRANIAGRQIKIESILCEGAFDALMSGDTKKHDAMVEEALYKLMGKCDVIVLAQASMARVADNIPASEKKIPILASPSIAINHLAEIFKS